eukprot:SM000016S01949  [mRNA]  locus=s16:854945:860887:- [translate_table: standard]
MRGGRYQQKASEDASSRNAEVLFETRTVVEIREVENRTRKDIEDKKEELRQLVGASYRDLIESADSILEMRRLCDAVVDNVVKMEAGFNALHSSIATTSTAPGMDDARKQKEALYGLGSRVKYLVDTPEKIWGCLDEHMYLEAAERYLRAREVHSLLALAEKGEQKDMLAAFPLLRHQWLLVEPFRNQIAQASRDRLQEMHLTVQEYAVALSAAAIIDDLKSDQVLSLFLDSRRSWLRPHIYGSMKPGVTPDAHLVGDVFCRLTALVQSSLCHAGELFLEVSTGQTPALFQTILTTAPGSQLFGGIPNPDKEAQLWRGHRDLLEADMTALSGKAITEACQAWLQSLAQNVSGREQKSAQCPCPSHVSEHQPLWRCDTACCASCAANSIELVEKPECLTCCLYPYVRISILMYETELVTRHLCCAVEGRQLLKHLRSVQDLASAETVVREEMSNCGALAGSLDWLSAAFGSRPDAPWDRVCELLLKEPLDLWKLLFESIFLERAKEVVDDGFSSLTIKEQVNKILVATKAPVQEDLNGLDGQLDTSELSEGDLVWQVANNDKDWASAKNSYFSPEVTQLRDFVDSRLQSILEDVQHLLRGPEGPERAKELAPYVQDRCFACILALIRELEHFLDDISSSVGAARVEVRNGRSATSTTRSDVERALVIGRFCAALGQYSTHLPLVLGSPSSWPNFQEPSQVAAAGLRKVLSRRPSWNETDAAHLAGLTNWRSLRRSRGEDGSRNLSNGEAGKLHELQSELRRVSISAHRIWVLWITEQLAETFMKVLSSDETLSSTSPLKGWEETVLKQEDDGGEEVEMRMALPAMPSSYSLSLLFSGCREIHRVGSHTLDVAVLSLFAWKLFEKVLAAYDNLTRDSAVDGKVSEKGILQLLFDFKFLWDVLSGGSEEDSNGKRTLDDRKKKVVQLLELLYNRIDPIDWATYEPYLWQNEQRYYHRCVVLFGSLIQLNRLHMEAPPKLPYTADTNTLNVSATVPRFSYLPISAPLLPKSNSASKMRRGFSQESLSLVKANTAANIETTPLSNLSLNDNNAYAGLAAGAKPLLKSFMGSVGTKFGEGTFKLGSILADGHVRSKSAVSSIGDMLPAQAAGLFSSLTAGASKPDS